MFGQFFELLPLWPGIGAVEWVVPVVPVPVVLDVLDVAAFAIAAPPPAIAPVTARVVSRGFSVRILVSPPLLAVATRSSTSVGAA